MKTWAESVCAHSALSEPQSTVRGAAGYFGGSGSRAASAGADEPGGAGLYVILSDIRCSEDFLLRSMRLAAPIFCSSAQRADFGDAMTRLEQLSSTCIGRAGSSPHVYVRRG